MFHWSRPYSEAAIMIALNGCVNMSHLTAAPTTRTPSRRCRRFADRINRPSTAQPPESQREGERMPSSSAYVLVHGAWCGGFIWRAVADGLRARGHRVFTPTLTGLADRSHLRSAEIGLDTHVADVVNLIKWEELTDIVLVGHSYGGMVISGVAEAVAPGTITSIVYLDAFYAPDGQSAADCAAPMAAMFQEDPIPFAFAGQTGDPHFETLVTPQPRRTLTDRPTLSGARDRIALKTYILATTPAQPWFVEMTAAIKPKPDWRSRELACGHATMLEMPEATVGLLLEAAAA
jgi:pimeloyl-ACP methyl ester carboxylesterase